MTFTLRVLQTPAGVPGIDPRRLEPSACPFAIGRAPDNDWILADPDRHISKVHCRIENGPDGLYLVDLSSNGVFFAAETRPVGRDQRRLLGPGDVFRIGDYRIALDRIADATLPDPRGGADRLAPGTAEGVTGILAGTSEASEGRAARSLGGSASDWLSTLPGGAVDAQVVQPFGWQAPPATSLTDEPEAMLQPLSDFASRSEHLSPVSEALQLGGVRAILPADWDLGDDAPPASGAAAGPDWGDAQAALVEGAGLGGLMPEGVAPARDRAAMVRSGQILRRLIDVLAALEAVHRTAERDLGLSDRETSGADLPSLFAAALATGDAGATDELTGRLARLAQASRALGLSVGEAAADLGAQIQPEFLEDAARERTRLAVGPLLRAASWDRYVALHANLCGAPDAPAADVVLTPLRRAYARRT